MRREDLTYLDLLDIAEEIKVLQKIGFCRHRKTVRVNFAAKNGGRKEKEKPAKHPKPLFPPDGYLTMRQTIEALGITRSTLEATLYRKGCRYPQPVKMEGGLVFRIEDLEVLREIKSRPPRPPKPPKPPKVPFPPEGYYTAKQAAAVLGVKVQSLWVMIRQGKDYPVPVKMGKRLAFRIEDVGSFIQAKKAAPSKRGRPRNLVRRKT